MMMHCPLEERIGERPKHCDSVPPARNALRRGDPRTQVELENLRGETVLLCVCCFWFHQSFPILIPKTFPLFSCLFLQDG